jgi:hypothetical protein
MEEEIKSLACMAYDSRNRDLDPQLVWRGKNVQDWFDLAVHAPYKNFYNGKVILQTLRYKFLTNTVSNC